MDKNNSSNLDIRERGRSKDGKAIFSESRLFFQFLAFGEADEIDELVSSSKKYGIKGVIYKDVNDYRGIGLLTYSETPDFFVDDLSNFLSSSPFGKLRQKHEFTMLGRTYSLGYEGDLEKTLVTGPINKILDSEWPWAIWYPLRRAKIFESLPEEEQRAILGEHGKIGFKFGKAGYAKDIRLACHGLDKNDNDFVIGVLGKELYPLSTVIQAMRKTKQTSMYLKSLGPFFVGKAIWQSQV